MVEEQGRWESRVSGSDALGPIDCSKYSYEEISPPNVEDFCYITDNTYTKQGVCVSLLTSLYAFSATCVQILPVVVSELVIDILLGSWGSVGC
jgi:hypothetical protein